MRCPPNPSYPPVLQAPACVTRSVVNMSVIAKMDDLLATLDAMTPEAWVLAESAYALALEIDVAQQADDQGKTRSCASAVTALRGVLAELIVKGRASASTDEADNDWTTPSAVVGLAAVRDAKEPGARDAGPRGGRGGAPAAQAVDAVAAARRGRGA